MIHFNPLSTRRGFEEFTRGECGVWRGDSTDMIVKWVLSF